MIDYLQDFNLEKRMESFIKITKASKENAKLISASHPDWYAQRFINFMKDTVVINQTGAANKDKVVPNSLVETIMSTTYEVGNLSNNAGNSS